MITSYEKYYLKDREKALIEIKELVNDDNHIEEITIEQKQKSKQENK